MATLIRATCSDCGDVELGTHDLLVRVCVGAHAGTYVFRCPRCDAPVVRPADGRTIDLLIESGCELQVWRRPAELSEPRPTGPPFGLDDVIDFHHILRGNDWFDDLLTADRRQE
jgi:hypothetical protein